MKQHASQQKRKPGHSQSPCPQALLQPSVAHRYRCAPHGPCGPLSTRTIPCVCPGPHTWKRLGLFIFATVGSPAVSRSAAATPSRPFGTSLCVHNAACTPHVCTPPQRSTSRPLRARTPSQRCTCMHRVHRTIWRARSTAHAPLGCTSHH